MNEAVVFRFAGAVYQSRPVFIVEQQLDALTHFVSKGCGSVFSEVAYHRKKVNTIKQSFYNYCYYSLVHLYFVLLFFFPFMPLKLSKKKKTQTKISLTKTLGCLLLCLLLSTALLEPDVFFFYLSVESRGRMSVKVTITTFNFDIKHKLHQTSGYSRPLWFSVVTSLCYI